MNAIIQALLGGAALGALATAPALAGDAPHFGITALHAAKVVNKTKVRDPSHQHVTYTFGVSTDVPASDFRQTVHLYGTYYKWSSTFSGSSTCSNPKQKLKTPKKSIYAKLGKATETYSLGCPSGPTVFYGDTYKLTDAVGEGQTDHFVSTLIGWFQNLGNGQKYKGTLYLDVSVTIGK